MAALEPGTERHPATAGGPPAPDFPAVVVIALGAFLLEMAVAGRYGYHRDELYFLASFHHLAVSYVDQPVLTPLLAGLGNAVFGGSLVGFRLLPALALGGVVVFTGSVAAELGAGALGQAVAASCSALCAEFLAAAHLVSPTPFDQLAWAATWYLVLRLVRTEDRRRWLGIGALGGLALEDKWNIGFLFLGLGVGFLATPERRLLRSPWLAGAAALAALLWAPSLAWQAVHGWPNFAVFRGLAGQASHNRLVYLPAQVIYTGLVATVVWIAGLAWLLRSPEARAYRLFGWSALVVLVLVWVLGGKPYYGGPTFTLLFAAGAVPIEHLLTARRGWLRPALFFTALGLTAAVEVPVALPVLPEQVLASVPLQKVNYDLTETIGWRHQVALVASVYYSLPPAERRTAVILTQNYGEAGAIDRYGPAWGLPPAESGNNNYWLWGPPPEPAGVTIDLNVSPDLLRRYFSRVRLVATFRQRFGIQDDEQGTEVFLATGQRVAWPVIWPAIRHYD